MLSFGITRLWPSNRRITGDSDEMIEQATSLAAMNFSSRISTSPTRYVQITLSGRHTIEVGTGCAYS